MQVTNEASGDAKEVTNRKKRERDYILLLHEISKVIRLRNPFH